ncbi:MAG: hypothetical protein WCK28_15975 [Burkholderiales bacterium]|jgi:hypothetical protein
MPTKALTSFEVLSSPIAPVPGVPYSQQGFFLQITNLDSKSALIGIEYQASPAFVDAQGPIKLLANVIDEFGAPQQYPTEAFLGGPVGFDALNIPAGKTWLVGVQYLLLPNAPLTEPPMDAFTTRGVVLAHAASGAKFMILATVRQVFSTFTPTGGLVETDSTAYSVAIQGGPEVLF